MTFIQRFVTARYGVLLDLEGRGAIDSRGLTESGQRDLSFVLPRTGKSAALNHAGALATELFDERISDRGFYHLFRLPMSLEVEIHRCLVTDDPLSGLGDDPKDVLSFHPDKVDPAKAEEGTHNLGAINPQVPRQLRKLIGHHVNCVAAGVTGVPYFSLPISSSD